MIKIPRFVVNLEEKFIDVVIRHSVTSEVTGVGTTEDTLRIPNLDALTDSNLIASLSAQVVAGIALLKAKPASNESEKSSMPEIALPLELVK